MAQLADPSLHVGSIDLNGLPNQVGCVETDVIEQPLNDGLQTPDTNVFGAFIHIKDHMRKRLIPSSRNSVCTFFVAGKA